MSKIEFKVIIKKRKEYEIETWVISIQTLIDNKLFSIFGACTDIFELLRSIKINEGVFNTFTCTCGVSGCAGFYDGVSIVHNKESNQTKWRFLDYNDFFEYDEPREFLEEYTFNYDEYILSVQNVILDFQNKYELLKLKNVVIDSEPNFYSSELNDLYTKGMNLKF